MSDDSDKKGLVIPVSPQVIVSVLLGLGIGGGGASMFSGANGTRELEAIQVDVKDTKRFAEEANRSLVMIEAEVKGIAKQGEARDQRLAELERRLREHERLGEHAQAALRISRLEEQVRTLEGRSKGK